jgi:hypothetical protein
MSTVTAAKHQIGISSNANHNFVVDASTDDGTMKIRNVSGSTTYMNIDGTGQVSFPQGLTGMPVIPSTTDSTGLSLYNDGYDNLYWIDKYFPHRKGLTYSGIQVIKCGGLNMPQAATRYAGILGTAAGLSSTDVPLFYIPEGMSITAGNLRVSINAAVAVGQSFTVTLVHNGTSEPAQGLQVPSLGDVLSVTLSAGSTYGENLATYDFNTHVDLGRPGGYLSVKVVSSATTGATTDFKITFTTAETTTGYGTGHVTFGSSAIGTANHYFGEHNSASGAALIGYYNGYFGKYYKYLNLYGIPTSAYMGAPYPYLLNANPRAYRRNFETNKFSTAFNYGEVLTAQSDGATPAPVGGSTIFTSMPPGSVVTNTPLCPLVFARTGHAQNTTAYLGGFGTGTGSLVESEVSIPMPTCFVSWLSICFAAAIPAGQSITVTVRKNGVDTASTKVCTSLNTAANTSVGGVTVYTTFTNTQVAFNSGDLLSIAVISSATAGTSNISASVLVGKSSP